MSTVITYYDGRHFVPIEPVAVRKGRIINLQIVSEETEEARTAARLAAFIQLTEDIHETNKTDPLPPEFDEIMGNLEWGRPVHYDNELFERWAK